MPIEECDLDPGYGKPVHVFPMGSRICQCGKCDCSETPPTGFYTGRKKRKASMIAEGFDRDGRGVGDKEPER